MELFKSLMNARSYNLSYQHVLSLNIVGLEFSGKKYKKVIAAWKLYLDHLLVKEEPEDRNDNSKLRMWVDKKNTLKDLIQSF